ncbi:hypothetical protein ID866_6297 [Astraeus odoratus]|nr:hypothetical protein ID866_6297 [Astraeus odoratus]
MHLFHVLTTTALVGVVAASKGVTVTSDPTVINGTCQAIAAAVSSASSMNYNGTVYDNDIEHWATSSTQQAMCAFEPGTIEDVGIALKIIAQNRCPFAVKGGGHATNPGFSSTIGVQIAMYRFSEITYDSNTQTVTVGAGLLWDDVYAALEPYGMNVVGGRISGIGVAGLTLGGGYSWLTNQYGLTIDTVKAYGLVLPNGTFVNVTETTNPDLFFALKNASTRSFVDLIQASSSGGTSDVRGVFDTVSVTGYPIEFLQAIVNESSYWGQALEPSSNVLISYDVEPFLPTLFSHNTTPSAYPGSRKTGVFPLNIYFAWSDESTDELMQNATRTTAATLSKKAIELGQNIQDAPLYNNYAIFDTPLTSIYGDNVHTLEQIRKKVDPDHVMGLAGGFKF